MQFGHVFTAKRGEAEALMTFGNSRNDQHASVFGVEPNNPNPVWVIGASALARASVFYRNDPARPLQTGVLVGLTVPNVADRFNFNDRQALLSNGIATLTVGGSNVMIERAITTYQRNSFGDADNSYLDSATLYTIAYIIGALKTAITSKYARHKLANDGTRYGPGQAIVTPKVIKSELIAQYGKLEALGLVENAELFAKYLVVERNKNDVNRIDVLLPPDVVNQLRIFAMQVQFRLQFDEE
jgi:phage tail sheath gpL-like